MSLFGFCLSAPGTRPDAYHGLCPGAFTDQFGIEHRCGCPAHERDEEED